MGSTSTCEAELGSYSVAVQQIVAIARAVELSGKVLILDEPTASLDRDEVERLFEVIRQPEGARPGIVFITHFLDQVFAICRPRHDPAQWQAGRHRSRWTTSAAPMSCA